MKHLSRELKKYPAAGGHKGGRVRDDEDELTPEQMFAAEDPSVTVPRDLARGRSKERIVADMVRLDWAPTAAAAYVDRVEGELRQYHASPEARRELVAGKVRLMAAGAVVVLFGLGFFAVTLLSVFSFGGAAVVLPVGVVAFGLLLFGRGFVGWRRYRRDELRL